MRSADIAPWRLALLKPAKPGRVRVAMTRVRTPPAASRVLAPARHRSASVLPPAPHRSSHQHQPAEQQRCARRLGNRKRPAAEGQALPFAPPGAADLVGRSEIHLCCLLINHYQLLTKTPGFYRDMEIKRLTANFNELSNHHRC
jgi:hypothetical protein